MVFVVVDVDHVLDLISAGALVHFGLPAFILSHIVFFHLFQQFQILSFGDLFVTDTHVGVGGSDPSH